MVREALKIGASAAVAGALGVVSRDLAGRYLARSLAEMTGLGGKAAQLLTMRLGGGQLPAPPPMPLGEVADLIATAAPELAVRLASLEAVGHAASIGQAHGAVLDDGRRVCVKVMRPGIIEAMRSQLEVALRLMTLGPPRKFEIDVDAYRRFLRERIEAELDYEAEATVQRRIRRDLAPLQEILVPEVLSARPTILVQAFEPADQLATAAAWPSERARRRAAEGLLAAFFRMTLKTGCLHADTHPGNLGFRLGDKTPVVLYDFGSTVDIPEDARTALQRLLLGEDAGDGLAALLAAGFDQAKLARVAGVGAAVSRTFAPLLSGRPTPVREWRLQERLRAELGPQAWWLRTAGPPWVLYVLRAFHGTLHAAEQLGCPVSLREALERALDTSIAGARSDRRAELLPVEAAARHLCVRIVEGGVERVSLEMPAVAVENLEDLVPEHTLTEIRSLGHDLSKIKESALRDGLRPRDLFTTASGNRTLRVWLE